MRVWFLIAFLFVMPGSIKGQDLKFKSLTTEHGLSNNSVVDIENADDGGLWVATWDGLNYYDGFRFINYKNDPSDEKSIGGNYIYDIEKDADGSIWTITEEGRVNRYEGNGKFENFQFDFVPTSIKKSKSGNIVVSGKGNTLEYRDGVFKKSFFREEPNKEHQFFKDILLLKYPDAIINDILQDDFGNVWLATRRKGLYIIPNTPDNLGNEHIDHYTYDSYSPFGINSNEVEKLHQDSFGNVWLGQKDGGLSMAYRGSEQISTIIPHPEKYPHLPDETIRAITKDALGRVWMGYYTKGLFYFDRDSDCFLPFHIKEGLEHPDWNRVRSLFRASDGSIWAGTYGGSIRIRNGRYDLFDADRIPAYPNNRSYSIVEDHKKQLWIACWGGVAKFDLVKDRFETFNGQGLLAPYHIRNVKRVGDELILATERNGMLLLDLKSAEITKIDTGDGILGNSVYSIYVDTDKANYWIGSLGGISILDKKDGSIVNLTEKEGLPSHMVYGLMDSGDEVWAGTTKGIAIIDKSDHRVLSIESREGWQAKEFSEGAYYKDPKGMLYFGGINGLNFFNPAAIHHENGEPKIKVEMAGKDTFSKSIKREHAENNVKIVLTPIVFPVPESYTYYYKLEGYDSQWNAAERISEIQYKDLPSGRYRFVVKNKEETQGEEVFSLHVGKAFYETPRFYVSIALVLMSGFFLLILAKIKRTRLQKKKLEDLVVARTKVIEDQKEDLIKINRELDEKNRQISSQKEKLLDLHNHLKNEDFEVDKFKAFVVSEFRQPVSEILKTSLKITDNPEIQEELAWQSGRIINLISEWNYLDQVKDMGGIKKTSVNLKLFLRGTLKKLKEKAKAHHVNFIGKLDKNISWGETDILRFRLLLQYLFTDIIKYSNRHSSLNVYLGQGTDFLQLTLSSNSTILADSWYSISRYSPYFKAFKVLLNDLNGQLEVVEKEGFKLQCHLPIVVIDVSERPVEIISWKHLDLKKKLPDGTNDILVFTGRENYGVANQLLENTDSNLLFEDSADNLTSALQHLDVNAFVIYHAPFDKELVGFLKNYKERYVSGKVPLIYISEEIDHNLQEQSLEFGIDTVIQLPASSSFIQNKITSLILAHREAEQYRFQQGLFKTLNAEDFESADDRLIKKSMAIIKDRLSDSSFNVEKLISILGISRIKCYRLFKEHLKQSPSDVITSLRLQKAEYLLKHKKLNISEISFECGYNDSKYFGKSFKKHFGMSPKIYKEQKT